MLIPFEEGCVSECSPTQQLQCKLPKVRVCVLHLLLLSLLPFEGDGLFGRCSGLLPSYSPIPSFVSAPVFCGAAESLWSLHPKQAQDALPELTG